MTSTATPLGFNKQGAGDNANTWGDVLNLQVFDLVDEAIRGIYSATLSGSHTLDATNYVSNESRRAILNITGGTGGTITVPDISKLYVTINGASGDVTVKGSGTGAVVKAGETCLLVNDGATVKRVQPTDFGGRKITTLADPTNPQDACTKNYADGLALSGLSGSLPGQGGNAGKFIKTDGATPSWAYAVDQGAGLASVSNDTVTVTGAAAADIRTGTDTSKAVTSAALTAAGAFLTLTDASTVAWDVTGGFNATVTLGGNRTIGAPANLKDGITYVLNLVQDGAGSRIPSWNTVWDFGLAGAPTLQTAAGKTDKVTAQYNAARGKLEAAFWKGA